MSQALKTYSKGAPFYNVWLVDVRFRGSTSETLMLPHLLRHCYCYADSRFSNPMVSGLAAYAMKRCSMKRKSIISDTRSSLVSAGTRTHARLPKNMQVRVEGLCRCLWKMPF